MKSWRWWHENLELLLKSVAVKMLKELKTLHCLNTPKIMITIETIAKAN